MRDTLEPDRENTLGLLGGEEEIGLRVERPWNPMSVGELKVFIGLQILMGVYRYPGIVNYWSGGQGVKRPEFEKMSCNRYQQIKRYFHLSPPDETYQRADWWRKMEPLASHLRSLFHKLYLPGSNMAFDEMMVLFKGRSLHTIKMPSKPIDQGYKIYALCEKGYTYSFLFYSGETKNEESVFTQETAQFTHLTPERSLQLFNSSKLPLSEPERKARSKGFSPTSQAVCYLIFQLPFRSFQFNIYMDNYFSIIPLFQHLRDYGIGAAGTTCPGRHDFLSECNMDACSGSCIQSGAIDFICLSYDYFVLLDLISCVTILGGRGSIGDDRYTPVYVVYNSRLLGVLSYNIVLMF